MAANLQLKLARRPAPGMLTPDVFEIVESPVPEPGPGEMRIAIHYVSCDPAMRGWLDDRKSYVPPVQLGQVMRAYACGVVEASNHPDFRPGDTVAGLFGVQKYAISNGERVLRPDTSIAPLERWIGGLGMPGWTAYFGLSEVGQPKAGETVVVSAASGAVGSIVGQLAKLKGCRAVGIAGGPEKCSYVTDVLGFDACVDYKAGDLGAQLDAACPQGIDVSFENVGGEVLDAILPRMNTFGRVALCGLISGYNAETAADGPSNFRYVLTQRLTVRGFIVTDWAARIPEAVAALSAWVAEGKLTMREDVRTGGVPAFVETLNLLYTGKNQGKLVLKLA